MSYGCDPDRDFSCHKPIYELRHNIDPLKSTGEAYDSVIDMRRDKIVNFVQEIKQFPWVVDVIDVQYEKLLSEGTEFLIKRVEEITGVKRQCVPSPSQERKKRKINQGMVKWLNDQVDWDVEGLIGYSKMEVDEEEEEEYEADQEEEDEEEEQSVSADETDDGTEEEKAGQFERVETVEEADRDESEKDDNVVGEATEEGGKSSKEANEAGTDSDDDNGDAANDDGEEEEEEEEEEKDRL